MAEATLDPSIIPALARGVVVRSFGNEALLTMMGTDIVSSLNDAAALVVALIDGERDVDALHREVMQRVEAASDVVRYDIEELLGDLLAKGFLTTS